MAGYHLTTGHRRQGHRMSTIEKRLTDLERRLQIDAPAVDLDTLAERIREVYQQVESGRLAPDHPMVQQVNNFLAIARERQAAHERH